MNLLFFNMSPLVFDVETPERAPLGGSESAVCYLARALAARGHNVTLMARLPPDTPENIMGVRHVPLAQINNETFFAAEKFAAVIVANAVIALPRLRELNPQSRLIFWCHMLPDQPAMAELQNPELRALCDTTVFLSRFHAERMEKAFSAFTRSAIIGNGMAPAFENMFGSPAEILAAKQNRAAYTSTPFRGLEALLDVAERLDDKTTFDIFSSMKVYQSQTDEHAALYQRATTIPSVHYHGAVSQKELATRLRGAAFLAYPCLFAETFCIAALEAMAAGLKVISTDLGALQETTAGYADILPLNPAAGREAFIAGFAALLEKNIDDFRAAPAAWAERMFEIARHVNRTCTWAARAAEWEALLGAAPAPKMPA